MSPPYYQREGVTILLGDCREHLVDTPRETFDLLLTDPPYGVANNSGTRARPWGQIAGDDDAGWIPATLSIAALTVRRNRHAYIFGSFALEEFPLRSRCTLVWDKMLHGSGDLSLCWAAAHEPIMFCIRAPDRAKANMEGGKVPARLRAGSVLQYKRPNATGCTRHPNEKPVALLRRLIESSSFPGETVLDPFCGSGSTLVAAVAEGRIAQGHEIEERYAETAAKRVDLAIDAALTAGKAWR